MILNLNTMKKLFSIMAVAVGLFAGYTTYNAQQNTELTGIALANVEALADEEIIFGPLCLYVPNRMCCYFWDDGTMDCFEGIIVG